MATKEKRKALSLIVSRQKAVKSSSPRQTINKVCGIQIISGYNPSHWVLRGLLSGGAYIRETLKEGGAGLGKCHKRP